MLDCILWDKEKDERPTRYQMEIMEALVHKRRVCVRAGRGAGKSCLSSWVVLHYLLTREALAQPFKIITTASAWQQVRAFLWPEIHLWSRKLKWDEIGRREFKAKEEAYTTKIDLKYGYARAIVSNRPDLIEGAHAPNLLYVFDESKAIPDAMWDSVEGAMTDAEAFWLAISTPAKPEGRFYDIQAKKPGYEYWWTRHVTLQETVDAFPSRAEWANQRREQWGEKSIHYKNHVLGEFAQEQSDSLVPLEWVEQAQKRWYAWKAAAGDKGMPTQVGADIARKGGDKTVIAVRYDVAIDTLEKYGDIDLMQGAGLLYPYVSMGVGVIYIDIIGLGSGVYDRLAEQFPEKKERELQPFHPQENTDFTDRTELYEFADSYSAAWWNLRELLDPQYDTGFCLPPDSDLQAELISPTWSVMSSGKIKVEPKEKVKERIGRSPDSADAVVLACWRPVEWDFGFG